MGTFFTRKAIAVAFTAWAALVRLRRRVRLWGRPAIGRLDHVTIPVHDLAAARAFYCEVLGAAYLMTVDDETFRRFGRPPAANGGDGAYHASVFMSGATRIDLFLQAAGQPGARFGHPHYAFAVPARRLGAWKRRLQAHGIPVEGPLQLGPPGQASLYFDDPFGNHIELAALGYTGPVEIRPPVMERLRHVG